MKQTKKSIIVLLLGFSLLLSLAGCEKDEPQYSIVGQWKQPCEECGVSNIFPENGIIEHVESGDHPYMLKYRMTKNNDSIQYITIRHLDNIPDSPTWHVINIFSYRVHFYNNDSIMIEGTLVNTTLIRVKE